MRRGGEGGRSRKREWKEKGGGRVLSEGSNGTDDKGCFLSHFVVLGVVLGEEGKETL